MTVEQVPIKVRPLGWRAMAAMALLAFTGAWAQIPVPEVSGVMAFDIPAQPLDAALNAFAQTSGWSALVDSRLTAGRRSTAVRGSFTPSQALLELIADTGLHVRYISSTSFTLAERPEAKPRAGGRGSSVAAYAGKVQAALTRSLCHWQGSDFGRYRAALQLWITQSGSIDRIKLLDTTGVPQRDNLLRQRLRGLFVEKPPQGMVQPLTILLTPRNDAEQECRAAGEMP